MVTRVAGVMWQGLREKLAALVAKVLKNMIEGLKVTISGVELRQLCEDRAAHHVERVEAYQGQVDSMKQAQVEGMHYTGGDPVKALGDKRAEHQASADELGFIAAHLDAGENYLLDNSDLEKIGVIRSRYGLR